MLELAGFSETGSFKIGAFKIRINDFSYDELCDVLGPPPEIFTVIGHEGVYLYKYDESGIGKILAFRENDKIVEIHFEPDQDILIRDMTNALGRKPKLVVNKRLKYLFFCEQICGRILDEKQGTMNILGFFSQEYLKKQKLPKFFLSGIAYDQAKLLLIYQE